MTDTSRDRVSSSPRRRRRAAGALAAGVLLAALAGCSGDDMADSPTSAAAGAPVQDFDAGSVEGEMPAATSGGAADEAATAVDQVQLLAGRKQILRADLVVESDAVLTDARRAEAAVTALGGVVTDEKTETDPGSPEGASGYTVSTLTMRVAPERLNDLLTDLAALGDLVSQSRGTTDVTDEYVDVQARITSQSASLERLLALVTDASDLSDVVALENEVSRRQSDLDALTARLKALDEEVTLATVSFTLTSAADDPVVASSNGFMGGLRSGWDAFTAAIVGGLTVFGALLPFAVTLALIGVPLYVLRSRRRTPSAVTPASDA